MAGREFVPIPPAGFDVAGSFDGATTAVGAGGAPLIRYQVTRVNDRVDGVLGDAARQFMKNGDTDEVTLGGLHTRLSAALGAAGDRPEAGIVERLGTAKAAGICLGRYLDRTSRQPRYAGIAIVSCTGGLLEILVTECDSEDGCRNLVTTALAPYL
jgi:hypothetical protein